MRAVREIGIINHSCHCRAAGVLKEILIFLPEMLQEKKVWLGKPKKQQLAI